MPSPKFFFILVKNVADFWPCPKSLPEPKLKKLGLIPLQRKSQNSLVLTLSYVYPWILLHRSIDRYENAALWFDFF